MQIPIAIEPDDRSWQDYANCLGVDPDLFFPERGASTREAKEVCRGCVVREDCLEYALVNGEKFGIWGGMSERERRRLRRQRALARRAGRPPSALAAPAPPAGPRWSGPRRGRARPSGPGRSPRAPPRAPGPPARRARSRGHLSRRRRGRRPSAGPTDVGVDQVHRHLHAVADGEAERPDARVRGSPRRSARASSRSARRARRCRRRAAARAPTHVAPAVGCGRGRTAVGRQLAERVAPHVGQRPLGPVEEARHAELVGQPRVRSGPGRGARRPSSMPSRGTNGTTSTTRAAGATPRAGEVEALDGLGRDPARARPHRRG